MKNLSNKMIVFIIVLSGIFIAGAITAIVLSAVFVLAKGDITGIAMIICFSLLVVFASLTLVITLSWKNSTTRLMKYDNDVDKV